MSVDLNGSPSPPSDSQPSNGPGGLHRPVAVGGLVHSREFLEFVAGLGPLMRQSADPVTSRWGMRRSSWLVIAALLVLLSALGWHPLSSWWSAYGSIPDELLGTWTTSSARFADRGFVITKDSLRFLLGPRESSTYRIVGVRRKTSPDSALYTFHYRDSASSLEFGLHMRRDSTVHVANLPAVVWRKASQ